MALLCFILVCCVACLWIARQPLLGKIANLQTQLNQAQSLNKSYQSQITKYKTSLTQQQIVFQQLQQKINVLEIENENPVMYAAWQAICRGENVFIHGKAGTGKSSFITKILRPRLSHTAYVTCTNIAALNIQGQTIYRFLSATPDTIFKPISRWEPLRREEAIASISSIKTLVIDEVSMLHRRVFEALDKRLREIKGSPRPFGGMQLVLIGDLFQLPPIDEDNQKTARFFFSSEIYSQLDIRFFELQKVYRQTDVAFAQALDVLRAGEGNVEQAVEFINSHSAQLRPAYAPCLYPYRAAVEARNKKELAGLPGPSTCLHADYNPPWAWKNEADLPAPKDLEIKPNAPIIFLANDPAGNFVNSDVGIFLQVEYGQFVSIFNARTKQTVLVAPYTWYQTKLTEYGEQVKNPKVFYRQYPFQLAYAVTIHKAQGLTLEGACINFGKRTFEAGQAYVALSRVKQVSGLYLEKPLKAQDFKVADEVKDFLFKQKTIYLT